MRCPGCGASAVEGAKFCENCGAKLIQAPRAEGFYGYAAGPCGIAPGFSRRLDAPEMAAALKKQQKAVAITGIGITLLPFLGFLIYGAVSDKMELGQAIFFGLVISVIFGLTALITTVKKKLSRPFEGTVADKKHIRRLSTRHNTYRSRNQWRIVMDCADGRRRKKDTTVTIFNYLQIGDRVRYLPQFPQPFEKYDKSADEEIPCMFCSRMNPAANDSCAFCRNPMMK